MTTPTPLGGVAPRGATSPSGPLATGPGSSGPGSSAPLTRLLRAAGAPSLTETTVPAPAPSRTPRRLLRVQMAAAGLCLLVGLFACLQLVDLRTQLASAPNLADQYARLAAVETNLIEAGNLTAQRLLSDSSADPTSRLKAAGEELITAAAERPGDSASLGSITAASLRYAAALQQAKDATSLGSADAIMTKELRPALADLRLQLGTEAAQTSWSYNAIFLWLAALIVVAAVGWFSVILARITHRNVNFGLLGTLVATVLIAVLGSTAIASAASADQASRGTQFGRVGDVGDTLVQVAALRSAQLEATVERKATPSTLGEISAISARIAANSTLSPSTTKQLTDRHKLVTDALSKPDFSQAASLLRSDDTVAADKAFTTAAQRASDKAVAAAATQPQTASATLLAAAVGVLVVALAGAGAAIGGVGARLREYR